MIRSSLSALSATRSLKVAAGGLLCFVSIAVTAAEPVPLVQGPQFAVTTDDVRADALRMPQEMRSIVLARPQTVTQLVSNLYARRAMAQQADAEALDKDPTVAAALKIARDKVLSDAWIEKQDKRNTPKPDIAEAWARTAYKAKPERFKVGPEVHARHILIAGTDADAKAQAEKILADLKGGADFAKLAKEFSADKSNADNGGDLGFFAQGRMVPEFDVVAFGLAKPGDLSGVVQTKFGYHIIQLQDRKEARVRSFDEVKDELMKDAVATIVQDARVAYAQKMQEGVDIRTEAIANFASQYAKENPKQTQPTNAK
jgi:peptidyl-prolyl cis-trans isomerase C